MPVSSPPVTTSPGSLPRLHFLPLFFLYSPKSPAVISQMDFVPPGITHLPHFPARHPSPPNPSATFLPLLPVSRFVIQSTPLSLVSEHKRSSVCMGCGQGM